MAILLGANTFICLLMFTIWSRSSAWNVLLKIVFLGLGMANGLMLLKVLGYLVRI